MNANFDVVRNEGGASETAGHSAHQVNQGHKPPAGELFKVTHNRHLQKQRDGQLEKSARKVIKIKANVF